MKCPYPDCQGDISASDVFCGECGRSLVPAAVSAFLQQSGQPQTAPPQTGPGINPQAQTGPGINPQPSNWQAPQPQIPNQQYPTGQTPNPQLQGWQAPIVQPQPAPRPQANRTPLIIGGVGVLVLLIVVGCLATVLPNIGNKPTPTPVLARSTDTATTQLLGDVPAQPTATNALTSIFGVNPTATATTVQATGDAQTFNFTLDELTQDNDYQVSYGADDAAGNKLGDVGLSANWYYTSSTSSRLPLSVIVELNKNTILELATVENPNIAEDNPAYEVAESGKTYEVVSAKGWIFDVTVKNLQLDHAPITADGTTGRRPVFSALDLDVVMKTGPDGAALAPTPGPGALRTSYDFDLSQLTSDNDHMVNYPLRADTGQKLGLLTVTYSFSYDNQNAPDLISVVEILINNKPVLELAASDEPAYASITPSVNVVQNGETYSATTQPGWQAQASVTNVAVDNDPLLPDGSKGKEPVFKSLSFTLDVHTTPTN